MLRSRYEQVEPRPFFKSFLFKSVFSRLEPAPDKAIPDLNGRKTGRYPQGNGRKTGLMGEKPGAIHKRELSQLLLNGKLGEV